MDLFRKYTFDEDKVVCKNGRKEEKVILKKMQADLSAKCSEMYIIGELNRSDRFAVSVVGSRKMTEYGRKACWHMVRGVAAAGVTIVSGLMYGIDIEAHKAALSVGGRTIAVLGYGFDYLENYKYAKNVANEIIKSGQGAILSEYSPETEPSDWSYPRRNRIVAGLTQGTIIVEAGLKSGSLITAGDALTQGKLIFVVPGSIFSSVSMGKHDLIKSGAILVDSPEDVLSNLGIYKSNYSSSKEYPKGLSQNEEKIYEILKNEALPLSSDLLVELAEINTPDLNVAITSLEMMSLVKRDPNGFYAT